MTSPRIESGEDLFAELVGLKTSSVLNEFEWLDIVADTLTDDEIPAAWRSEAKRLIEDSLGQSIEDSLVR